MLEFEFVQIAIGNKDKFLGCPSDEEWRRFFYFAQKQSLVGFVTVYFSILFTKK